MRRGTYWHRGRLVEYVGPAPKPTAEQLLAIGADPNQANLFCWHYKKATEHMGEQPHRALRIFAECRRRFPFWVRYLVDSKDGHKYGKEFVFRDGSVVTIRYDQPGQLHASKDVLEAPAVLVVGVSTAGGR